MLLLRHYQWNVERFDNFYDRHVYALYTKWSIYLLTYLLIYFYTYLRTKYRAWRRPTTTLQQRNAEYYLCQESLVGSVFKENSHDLFVTFLGSDVHSCVEVVSCGIWRGAVLEQENNVLDVTKTRRDVQSSLTLLSSPIESHSLTSYRLHRVHTISRIVSAF